MRIQSNTDKHALLQNDETSHLKELVLKLTNPGSVWQITLYVK